MNDLGGTGRSGDADQRRVDAAEQLARLVVGEDDESFVLVFGSLLNLVDGFQIRSHHDKLMHAHAVMMRSAAPEATRSTAGRRSAIAPSPGPPVDSVLSDPVFLANAKRLISNRKRVIGGRPTTEYPDCVALGGKEQWCCTGTLVAPNVVITAGHCLPECAARVLIGVDVTRPEEAQVIEVKNRVVHPIYRTRKPKSDLAVLILAEDARAKPRPLATAEMVAAAESVRLAGYGNTDVYSSGGYGIRRLVDVPMASRDPKYGADARTEFVAGAPFLDRDSCNGDSGGPAYVQADGQWYLAGATSRATASAFRPCGDGGIYTQLAEYDDWIRSVPGGHWS
jgi:secreted trypsin-like serine protease